MSNGHSEFVGRVTTGRRLEQPEARPGHLGSISPLAPANERTLRLANQHFTEVQLAELEQVDRKRWRGSDGQVYRLIRSQPIFDARPTQSGCRWFAITGDRLMFFRPDGEQVPVEFRVSRQHLGDEARSERGRVITERAAGLLMASTRKKYVQYADWLAAKNAGADPGLRPADPAELYAPLGKELPVAVPSVLCPPAFALYEKPKTGSERRAEARAEAVDALLEAHGIRPKRRRR